MAEDRGTWARGGAVVSAALASMCCILPLSFGALGLSTTVVAAFFETLRPWFPTLATLLLGVGIYFALRRPARGEVCPDSHSDVVFSTSRVSIFIAVLTSQLSRGLESALRNSPSRPVSMM